MSHHSLSLIDDVRLGVSPFSLPVAHFTHQLSGLAARLVWYTCMRDAFPSESFTLLTNLWHHTYSWHSFILQALLKHLCSNVDFILVCVDASNQHVQEHLHSVCARAKSVGTDGLYSPLTLTPNKILLLNVCLCLHFWPNICQHVCMYVRCILEIHRFWLLHDK